MKKTLLLLTFMALPFFTFAQAANQDDAVQQAQEQKCYLYNIVTFKGSLNNEGDRKSVV